MVKGKKKGYKRYRNIMEGKRGRKYSEKSPMQIAAGLQHYGVRTWGGGGVARNLVSMNYGLWTRSMINLEFKGFLFRLMHGRPNLNNQAANFR